ncbi:leukemia-associated protein 7 [Dryobates pubescens]|uniref:leukemia-associated protein 7 n=1 Tax=Dryobates pubescens TaxID=118200 RepID=UPI0023B9BCD2|nr:leukemia-associated protein 7 [Dryobates pubescens]
MAHPAALLVSIRHRAGALHTLKAATVPPLPSSPPQISHTQAFSTSRYGPTWQSPGEEMELPKPDGAQGLQGERNAQGKSPKEEERGDLHPLSPSEPGTGKLTQPGLARLEPLRETGLGSKMSPLAEATSLLVQVEQTLLLPLLQQHSLPIHLQDSIEFRNICSRMALQREEPQFERDLHEAQQHLKTITVKLADENQSIQENSLACACLPQMQEASLLQGKLLP